MYIPLLDNVIVDLQSRFPPNVLMCFDLNLFLPMSVLKYTESKVTETEKAEVNQRMKNVTKNFKSLLPVPSSVIETLVEGEMNVWKAKWMRKKDQGGEIPASVIDAIQECDADVYPIINSLLKILITLPVSVASAERSFSILNLVKSTHSNGRRQTEWIVFIIHSQRH